MSSLRIKRLDKLLLGFMQRSDFSCQFNYPYVLRDCQSGCLETLRNWEVLKNVEVFSDWVYSIIIPFLMTFIEMKSCYYYKAPL